jgi:membrane protein YdbS with pleckstrin-like domain
MDLHQGEEIVFQGRPSWRSIIRVYLLGTLVVAVAVVIAALVASTGVAVLVGVVGMAALVLFGWLKRVGTRYIISTQRLHIRRGILAKRVQQTRIDRVQNVNTSQGPLERLLRVGTVDFDTAGTDDSEFRFVGVAAPETVVAQVDRAQREAADAAGPMR